MSIIVVKKASEAAMYKPVGREWGNCSGPVRSGQEAQDET